MKLLLAFVLIASCTMLFSQADSLFLAADQSLMIMPTAYTMPKGNSAFTVYELLLMQYSYAPIERMHISTAMIFPIHKEMFKTFSFGTKVNYYRNAQAQSAIWSSYTPDSQMLTLGNVFSFGNPEINCHAIIAAIASLKEKETALVTGLGYIGSLSPRTSFIAEGYYLIPKTYSIETLLDKDIEEVKLLALGIRFKGERMSWDFGAGRPLEDVGEIIFLPFIKATFIF